MQELNAAVAQANLQHGEELVDLLVVAYRRTSDRKWPEPLEGVSAALAHVGEMLTLADRDSLLLMATVAIVQLAEYRYPELEGNA